MTITSLFATRLYEAQLDDRDLMAALERACRQLAREDKAGRRWCETHGYSGYTSYASLDDLPYRDPAFADLKLVLDRHARAFADSVFFDLGGKRPKLDNLWVNILKPDGVHSGHIHPHSIVSGTVYVRVPSGAGALKLEDPRLAMMMAAPGRTVDAPVDLKPFHYACPKKATVYLWESWLRHEVVRGDAKSDRISISFNYR
jgi:uncharacterized protein (TIGR02466 family)